MATAGDVATFSAISTFFGGSGVQSPQRQHPDQILFGDQRHCYIRTKPLCHQRLDQRRVFWDGKEIIHRHRFALPQHRAAFRQVCDGYAHAAPVWVWPMPFEASPVASFAD